MVTVDEISIRHYDPESLIFRMSECPTPLTLRSHKPVRQVTLAVFLHFFRHQMCAFQNYLPRDNTADGQY